MKSIRAIFKNNTSLMDENEVIELMDYCKELESEIYDMKFSDTKVMENKLAEVVRDIYKSVNMTVQDQKDAIRFGETESVDFEECVNNLKHYILDFATKNKFRL
jgi:flagellar biosynthesis regulator FlaF